ncbi:hypothetical protein NPX13_g4715 [Xylaria arbuscula]|uniref:Uncharacterized protein n=1 Tax=Xylaria arbuscula TaxID=114810 RepID=A0A9W8NFU7_9PEZI|nr:hypothetical protein NPX13_g4715 [Xylaria arbuscula]
MATSTNLQFVWECRNVVEHVGTVNINHIAFPSAGPVPKVGGVYSMYARRADLFLHSEQEPGPTHGHLMDRHEDVINLIVQQSMATHVLRCKVLHIEATGLLDCQTSSVPFVRCQAYCWLDKKDTMEPTPNPMGNAAGAAKLIGYI